MFYINNDPNIENMFDKFVFVPNSIKVNLYIDNIKNIEKNIHINSNNEYG